MTSSMLTSIRRFVSTSARFAPCRRLYTTALDAERSDFLQTFIDRHKPCEKSLYHFLGIDWARRLIQDERYEAIPFFSRHFIDHTGENLFFAQTVNTDTTIPHLLSLRLKDFPSPSSCKVPTRDAPITAGETASNTPMEVICLMSLDRGLDSHASVVHGGFQCVIFDEIIRFLILLHYNNASPKAGPRTRHLTASMTVSYLSPVTTPATVLVRSHLVRREGRKWFALAEIVDSGGQTLTRAESTWVTAKPPRP